MTPETTLIAQVVSFFVLGIALFGKLAWHLFGWARNVSPPFIGPPFSWKQIKQNADSPFLWRETNEEGTYHKKRFYTWLGFGIAFFITWALVVNLMT